MYNINSLVLVFHSVVGQMALFVQTINWYPEIILQEDDHTLVDYFLRSFDNELIPNRIKKPLSSSAVVCFYFYGIKVDRYVDHQSHILLTVTFILFTFTVWI